MSERIGEVGYALAVEVEAIIAPEEICKVDFFIVRLIFSIIEDVKVDFQSALQNRY